MRVVVEEAHRQKLKVAAHATTPEGIWNAVTAGVSSIEHGTGADKKDLELMKARGTFLVPTVGLAYALSDPQRMETMTPAQQKRREVYRDHMQEVIMIATELGVKIASGYDAESALTQGSNANELIALTVVGMNPIEAIRAATVSAADLLDYRTRSARLKWANLLT